MAVLAVQNISNTGLSPSFVAASAGGDQFPNDGRVFFVVKNGGASAVTVTINSIQPCDQGYDHDLVVSVPAAGERWIGLFSTTRFNNASGNVEVTYSGVTSVTVAAIKA